MTTSQVRPLTQQELNVVNAAKAYVRRYTGRTDRKALDEMDKITPGIKALCLAVTNLEQLEQAKHDFVVVRVGNRVDAVTRQAAIVRKYPVLWDKGAKTPADATKAFAQHIVETKIMPVSKAAAKAQSKKSHLRLVKKNAA